MDISGAIVIAVLVVASIAGLVLWIRGSGQPIVLRDGSGQAMDPDRLEQDEPDDLPITATDNRYLRTPRFLVPGVGRWGRVAPPDPDYVAMRERERLTPRMPTEKDD